MQLSREAFERAEGFVRSRARPLDRALFEYHFSGGPRDAVLEALAAYRNPDGGFGQCLEPDFRLAGSSPLATTVAFQYLQEVKAPSDHPLVAGGIGYLVETFDPSRGRWEIVPPAVNDVPRAPWWGWEADPEPGFRANPGAEIVGYFHAYPEGVPAELRKRTLRLLLEHLETEPEAIEMHDAFCYFRAAEHLPEPEREQVLERVRRAAAAAVPSDPAAWGGYVATPLSFVRSPDSPLAAQFAELLPLDLDRMIEQQAADGSWEPGWEWGQFEETWPIARQEWQGYLTVQGLKTLRAFGRA